MVGILGGRNTDFSWTVISSRSVGRIRLSVFQHSQDQERYQPLDPEECEPLIGHSELSIFRESRVWRKLFSGIPDTQNPDAIWTIRSWENQDH
jgi:hypothetical protein